MCIMSEGRMEIETLFPLAGALSMVGSFENRRH